MIELHTVVGRLIGVVAVSPTPLSEFAAFRSDFTQTMAKVNRRIIIALDARRLQVLPADVEAALGRLMAMDNAVVERAAYLVDVDTPARPQLEALANAAKNPGRRVFAGWEGMRAFLAPTLEPQELEALGHMLGR